MSEPDSGAAARQPVHLSLVGRSTNDAFAWALLAAFVAGMAILAFHDVPEKQLTIYSGMLGAVVGAGVTKFIEFVWGAAKNHESSAGGAP